MKRRNIFTVVTSLLITVLIYFGSSTVVDYDTELRLFVVMACFVLNCFVTRAIYIVLVEKDKKELCIYQIGAGISMITIFVTLILVKYGDMSKVVGDFFFALFLISIVSLILFLPKAMRLEEKENNE